MRCDKLCDPRGFVATRSSVDRSGVDALRVVRLLLALKLRLMTKQTPRSEETTSEQNKMLKGERRVRGVGITAAA